MVQVVEAKAVWKREVKSDKRWKGEDERSKDGLIMKNNDDREVRRER